MSLRFGKKPPPFTALPRHKRSEAVVSLKGKIQRDAGQYGGLFTSHLVISEPGRPDLYCQWFDFYFPGKDRFTLWNAFIKTARQAFWDEAHELAHERTASMLTREEREADSRMEFEPADVSSTGKGAIAAPPRIAPNGRQSPTTHSADTSLYPPYAGCLQFDGLYAQWKIARMGRSLIRRIHPCIRPTRATRVDLTINNQLVGIEKLPFLAIFHSLRGCCEPT